MAKNSSGKTSTPSRVRFVMVEAELGDGDIGPITQAIQNALRSPAPALATKRLSVTKVGDAIVDFPEMDISADDVEQAESDVDVAETTQTKARGQRKPSPTPDIVDIDMNSDVSLAKFANGKDAKSQNKKYLIAAAWLKEHRNAPGVNAGHIYTCFRSMGWSTNIPDFWQPLRDLKSKKFFIKNENNEYEINHIGLDYVKRLGDHGAG